MGDSTSQIPCGAAEPKGKAVRCEEGAHLASVHQATFSHGGVIGGTKEENLSVWTGKVENAGGSNRKQT